MKKRITVLDTKSGIDTKTDFGTVCGISAVRLSAIMDYREFSYGARYSAIEARTWLQNLGSIASEVIIFIGKETVEAAGLEGQDVSTPFVANINGGTHMGIIIERPTSRVRSSRLNDRIRCKKVLADVISLCEIPVTNDMARISCDVVWGLGDDNISFWTRKILKEIEAKLERGDQVDKFDLGQLMQSYAQDVQFLKNKEAL